MFAERAKATVLPPLQVGLRVARVTRVRRHARGICVRPAVPLNAAQSVLTQRDRAMRTDAMSAQHIHGAHASHTPFCIVAHCAPTACYPHQDNVTQR